MIGAANADEEISFYYINTSLPFTCSGSKKAAC